MTPHAQIPDGSVIITPTEMYRELRATHDTVRDVAHKLDAIVSDHGQAIDDHSRDLADHETRIRSLEHARWPLPSLAALASLASLGVAAWSASGR